MVTKLHECLVHVFVIVVRRSQGVGRLLVVIMEGIDLMDSHADGMIKGFKLGVSYISLNETVMGQKLAWPYVVWLWFSLFWYFSP